MSRERRKRNNMENKAPHTIRLRQNASDRAGILYFVIRILIKMPVVDQKAMPMIAIRYPLVGRDIFCRQTLRA